MWPKPRKYYDDLNAMQLRQALEEREDVGLYDIIGEDAKIV